MDETRTHVEPTEWLIDKVADEDKPFVQLTGESGNVFYIIGTVRMALRRAGRPDLEAEFTERATSGDYDNALRMAMTYADVE